ncbi:MAG: hypothetical protein AAF648_14940 [Pseudomonadota bacterium]
MGSPSTAKSLPLAIVLGGTENGLTALRTLAEQGIPCALATDDSTDLALASRLPKHVFSGECADRVLEDVLAFAPRQPSPPVLLVTSDAFLRACDRQRQYLPVRVGIQLASSDAIDRVLDKRRFCLTSCLADAPLARGCGLSVPPSTEEIAAVLALNLPVILKRADTSRQTAADSRAALGHSKAARYDELGRLAAALDRAGEAEVSLLAQEYIPGDDSDHYSYMAYLGADGTEHVAYGVRKHRLSPIHHGSATCASLVDEPALIEAGRTVAHALDYRGAISVCFKRRPDTGAFVCYEVNGRLPLVHSVGHLAGHSLVLAAYNDQAGTSFRLPPEAKSPRALWMCLARDARAARAYRRARELGTIRWLWSLRHVERVAEWSWRDPWPAMVSFKRLIRPRRSPAR